jgi:sulfatase modifying factor 1
MRANTKRTAWFAALVAAVAFACLRPTEITVNVTAEPALCATLQTTIATGAPGNVVSVAEASARVTGCPRDTTAGDLGSVVVVPSGDRGAKIEVRVVAAVGKSPEACTPTSFEGCIEARRVLRFAKHQPLELPIALHASCIGVQCPDGTACVDGRCFVYDPDSQAYCDPASPTCAPVDAGAGVGVDAVTPSSDAAPGPCPAGGGPTMVRVTLPGGVTFCIDSTEVSDSQFAAFVATKPDVTKQIPACKWKTAFAAANVDDLPVIHVDWCDANAFCAWAGKRLCKTLDGALPSLNDAATSKSEWHLACSGGGGHAYPYGDIYQPEACMTEGAIRPDPNRRAVGLYPTCVGGFPGIFDLSGGVHEWVDGCDGDTGPNDLCRTEGGSWEHPRTAQTCAYSEALAGYEERNNDTGTDVGFRCCAD